MTGGYVGSPKKPIAMLDTYSKAQADATFADKTSATAQDFEAMPSVGGDPIVESGSNSDGEWTRWADGTQKVSLFDRSQVYGDLDDAGRIIISITFPADFFSINGLTIVPSLGIGGTGQAADSYDSFPFAAYTDSELTTTGFDYCIFSQGGAGARTFISYLAFGRWK